MLGLSADDDGAGAPAGGGSAGAGEAKPKTVAQVLGEIVWLLSQSPAHRHLTLADLEWLAMPPILLRQFRLTYAGDTPVALELWAMVDDTVAARLAAGDTRLTPEEWRCGERKILTLQAAVKPNTPPGA